MARPRASASRVISDIKLGPITARFAGEGRLTLSAAEQRLNVEGRGVDRKEAPT